MRAGQRGAAIMSLIRSAQLNGHDPHAYLKDILTRLPTHRVSDKAASVAAETHNRLTSPVKTGALAAYP
jgi:mannitol-1-phosphate/altronate dehydrogenase